MRDRIDEFLAVADVDLAGAKVEKGLADKSLTVYKTDLLKFAKNLVKNKL